MSGLRILVADDDDIVAEVLETALREWGHEVVRAADGQSAWNQLQRRRFDLAILDWTMPRLEGPDLCRMIRQTAKQYYIYLIICTTHDSREHVISGLDAGADDFVIKPVDMQELSLRVSSGQRVVTLQQTLEERNRSLHRERARLAAANADLRRDLEAAAAVQKNLLPARGRQIGSLCLDWIFCPAHYVAGDMFDCLPVDPSTVALYLLDVSGHSLPSALLSVGVHRLLSQGDELLADGRARPPEEVVASLNQRYLPGDLYFTLVYATVAQGRVRLTQAGHPPALHLDGQGRVQALGDGGFPVGLVETACYDRVEVDLLPRERLFLYSDGVEDCFDPQGRAFGRQRLMGMLERTASQPLWKQLAAVEAAVVEWRGHRNFEDDVSVVAVERVQEPVLTQ